MVLRNHAYLCHIGTVFFWFAVAAPKDDLPMYSHHLKHALVPAFAVRRVVCHRRAAPLVGGN
jgi:hypothetical protein